MMLSKRRGLSLSHGRGGLCASSRSTRGEPTTPCAPRFRAVRLEAFSFAQKWLRAGWRCQLVAGARSEPGVVPRRWRRASPVGPCVPHGRSGSGRLHACRGLRARGWTARVVARRWWMFRCSGTCSKTTTSFRPSWEGVPASVSKRWSWLGSRGRVWQPWEGLSVASCWRREGRRRGRRGDRPVYRGGQRARGFG